MSAAKSTNRFSLFFLCFLCLFVAGCQSQSSERKLPPSGLTVEQIFDRYTKAIGGTDAIQKIHSRVIKGTVNYTGVGQQATVSLGITWKAPDKFSEVMYSDNGEARRGYNGAQTWGVHWQTGSRQLMPAEIIEMKREAALYQPLLMRDLYESMSSDGRMNIEGRETEVISAVTKEGKRERFYFDTTTYLPIRLDLWDGGPEAVRRPDEFYLARYYLSDYKVVDGLQIPFTIRRVRPNSTAIYKYEEVRHNVETDEKVFEPIQPPGKERQSAAGG